MRCLCAALVVVTSLGAGVDLAAAAPAPNLSQVVATRIVLENPKVARWLSRYPRSTWVTTAEFRPRHRRWDVSVFSGKAGQIVAAKVDDRSRRVVEAWVGPQVAWPLARGDGLGGVLNRPLVWLAFCAFFFLGLADLRRPLNVRNLDLLGVLSFSVYLAFFNDGRVFAADLAAAASLAYLIGRCTWIGFTNRAPPGAFQVPVWLLVMGLVFLGGLRIGLNTEKSTVVDVGYAGVIGADRLVRGETPYGNFPGRDTGTPCGPPNDEGEISDWVQANGRCETANPLGDTYGPVNYHAYLPGLALFGWSGKWDFLPAVHFTTLLFDTLVLLGLAAIGLRYGGTRLAVTLAFAWVANPFSQYASSSNTNDAIMTAFLVWAFWAATSPAGSGALVALASWTKLAALVVVPLWATYPNAGNPRRSVAFAGAFAVATVVSFWVLFAGGDPLAELSVFYDRTFRIQAERTSPFSLWDWGRLHASGLPDLKWLQRLLQVLLVLGALALAFVPRRKTPLQLAALTAALLMAFELLLTHWSALYVAWFAPFVALATLTGRALQETPSLAASSLTIAPVSPSVAEAGGDSYGIER
jgi:hypothetical protein